jgi:16S rRNA U1498 N3-methylase RsmE
MQEKWQIELIQFSDKIDRVSLGGSILRAETAAIAAIASVSMLGN